MEAGRLKAVRWGLLALFVALVAYAHWWYGIRHHFYDLKIYRQAIDWWLDGHDLYTFTKPDDTQGALGFTYPPFGAMVLVPFALLAKNAAVTVYAVIALAGLLVTSYWLVAPVARRHGWSLPFMLVLSTVVFSTLEPIRETFSFGQINVLLILLILADLLILLPRESRWAGVLIGLAAAIKLTPAIFIVYLLVSRRYRAGITAIVSAAVATLIAAAVAPRASWDFWSDTLWKGDGIGNKAYIPNQSLRGLLARYDAPTWLWVLLVLAVVAAGLWRARRAALAGDEVVGLTIAGLVGCLASPITWIHHLYWFVPALVVLVDAGRRWLAVLIAVTVGVGMVSLYDQGLPVDPWGKGVLGFFIENWYVLLAAALLFALPIRRVGEQTTSGGAPASEVATVR
ncbi:glycosyltransferase 87 family protein [Dactylosporangium sp. NBC_01737]|uniref:glycosyltransferase 87 family protein n=1 Tax=Dactylosporangium sp. NBC_01737 TaxID=2975959 RepID=UPI002E161494|nr:glycosyltransferase 87 family protein [Dactylosporangium sp. NBC_01737]